MHLFLYILSDSHADGCALFEGLKQKKDGETEIACVYAHE